MVTLENQDPVHRPCCPEKLQAISEADLDRIAPRTSVVRPSLWRRFRSRIRCSRAKAYSLLLDYIPVLRWLPRYPVRDWLLGDFVSGISVGIIQLPQGLAYSLLASLPPVFGLYTSFYPVFIYFLLGTSRHISVGTFAVICVMIGSVLETLAPNENFMLGDNSTIDTVARDLTRVEISMALAFLVGLFQLALGLIQFGCVVAYLSDPLISGYTTASAVHVLVSQLKYLFGIRVSQKTQPLSLIYTIINICSRIRETNIGTLVTSIIAIVILLLMKFFNGTFASKLVIPVPIELIMLIVSTGISYGVDLYKNFGIENVGHIPVGLKAPLLPDFSLFGDIVGNAFAIAVVAYAITISLGKVFASKHGYKVDSNQELIAIGFSNLTGSFFQCFAISASVSRSLVQESTGGNSQVASAIASFVILIIILRAGELFQDLPKAILASIIIVNLKGMFNQFSEVRVLWRSNRIDLLTWLVTFAATILFNMDIGLAISVAFSLLTIIFRTQLSNFSILGQVYETSIYRDVSRCHQAKEIPRIKIFHSSSTVYYANADQYLGTLYRKCGVDVEKLIQKKRKAIKKRENKELKALKKAKKENEASEEITGHDNIAFDHLEIGNFEYAIQENKEQETADGSVIIVPKHAGNEESGGKSTLQSLGLERPNFHSLILDFSSVNFVDTVCVKVLRKIFKSFAEIEVDVYLAGCNATVIKGLEDGNLFNETITKSQVFPSIHDAVTYLTMDHDQISIHETNGAPDTRL
ncbi:solute carrier family 26 member 6-like isoform X1 [Bufo gargarizans]|uniref:solute carrier family 26 member 6-like isoform X1 n=2 Tax=Bufo gargarizans TaxID=30331 RepID=UPI001CF30E56|nr:solute carrier family 26 member 6-like isoform X1 [Bufo gargarizans]